MSKKIHLLRLFPFLRTIFLRIFPKILDFTNFSVVQGNVALLIEERNVYFRNSLNQTESDIFHLELIDLLENNYLSDISLVRIGPDSDGGYFIPEVYVQNNNWVCIGLGYNFEFENVLAKKKCFIYCFDHTIEGRPRLLDKSIKYFPQGWGSLTESEENNKLLTLDGMFHKINEKFDNNTWCLKFDIEGNEWKCIDQICNLDYKPDVIVCEIHGLLWGSEKYQTPNIINKLKILLEDYVICYLNGNNYSPYFKNANYGIYNIIELTLIRRNIIKSIASSKKNTSNNVTKNNKMIEQMPFGRFRNQ